MICRTSIRTAYGVVGLCILLMAVAGFHPAVGGEAAKQGGTLIYAMEAEPDILDPHVAGGWHTNRLTRQMHDCLVGYDLTKPVEEQPTPKLVGVLAEKWDISPDGKVYTFHLRKGVKFHDGTPFNADAVRINVERVWFKDSKWFWGRGPGRNSRHFAFLTGLEVVDDHTIKLIMSQPFSEFLPQMANVSANGQCIVSPTQLEKLGNENYHTHPVGTGPFEFVERVRGDRVVLKRFEGYWGEKALLDKLIIRPMPEASARVTALQTGEADVIVVPPPDSREQLEREGFKWVQAPRTHHVWYLIFNMQNEHFKNKLVRQAVNYAIDRVGMAKHLLKDSAEPAIYGLLPPVNTAFDPNIRAYEYNPQKARALLKEAGYPNGFKTVLHISVDGSGQMIPVPMMEFIQNNLKQVGIDGKIEAFEWVTYLGMWSKGMEPHVGIMQLSWGQPNPNWLPIVLHSRWAAPKGSNAGYYSDPELDKVMEAALAETDPEQAKVLWQQANRMATEEAALAGVVHDRIPLAMSPKVQGFVHPGLEWWMFDRVWLGR
jgi:peptide/nickel transport system substrate-binding protein